MHSHSDTDETLTEPPPSKQPRTESSQSSSIASVSDIADLSRSAVTDLEKYQIINNHTSPDPLYKFPRASTSGRAFQHQWFAKYPWLRYSNRENGGYCLPCMLFSRVKSLRADPGVLVTNPMTNLKKALETLQKHNGKDYHMEAVAAMDTFMMVMSGQQKSVSVQLSDAAKALVIKNRKKLQSIVETIILCGRQNIPLRGHRDSAIEFKSGVSESSNHGNFWALLQFRISSGDTVLRDHLAHAPRNATYVSPDIQNQVIQVLGDHVRDKVLLKVRRAQCFTLVADEVTDCSNKEQLGIILRYVDAEDYTINEDFITFLECDSGITGEALAKKMLDFLTQHLNPTKLRGQAYDGASNMSGRTNGAAARISSQFPLAIYTHCASHCLNLAVVTSLEEASVRNMIGVVNRVSLFFSAHPKRQRKLEEAIVETQPQSSVQKLKDLCRTRWIERIDALDRFKKLHPSIVACMETISSEGRSKWSPDSVTDANTLLLAITTTQFVSSLVIAANCLQYLLGLTRSLQAEAKDIVEAVAEINNLVATLKNVRSNVDKYHSEWFSEVERMCSSIGTTPSMPRLCGRQRHRPNVPATTPSDYSRRTITVPMLDHLVLEVEKRFDAHQQTALQGLYLVPSLLVHKTLDQVSPKVQQLGALYAGDLPNPESLNSEFHSWYVKWKNQEREHGVSSLPTSLYHTLPKVSSMYPNIKALLVVLCTLPVTSCSAERSFSGLKHVKTSLRSTMGNNRLSSLSMLYIHRDIAISLPEVIEEFARHYPRRLQLANIFS